jgi:hypothetical protein
MANGALKIHCAALVQKYCAANKNNVENNQQV